MRLLLLDNFDSFTYMLVDYLTQAGAECLVYRNDVPMATITAQSYDAVVLSPGPGTPADAGCLIDVIAQYHCRLPMLGVCLGQQAIGQFFGATLAKSHRPMHGKVSPARVVADDPLFCGVPARFRVTRYHSLRLTNLPPDLETTVVSETETPGDIMAIRHRALPLWGVQFHPEAALTEFGLTLLSNFIRTTKPVSDL